MYFGIGLNNPKHTNEIQLNKSSSICLLLYIKVINQEIKKRHLCVNLIMLRNIEDFLVAREYIYNFLMKIEELKGFKKFEIIKTLAIITKLL